MNSDMVYNITNFAHNATCYRILTYVEKDIFFIRKRNVKG